MVSATGFTAATTSADFSDRPPRDDTAFWDASTGADFRNVCSWGATDSLDGTVSRDADAVSSGDGNDFSGPNTLSSSTDGTDPRDEACFSNAARFRFVLSIRRLGHQHPLS